MDALGALIGLASWAVVLGGGYWVLGRLFQRRVDRTPTLADRLDAAFDEGESAPAPVWDGAEQPHPGSVALARYREASRRGVDPDTGHHDVDGLPGERHG